MSKSEHKKQMSDFSVVANRKINDDFFILELKSAQALPEIFPGQFVQARIDQSNQVFLRRTFSIHDVDAEKQSIKLLIRLVREGTKTLSKIEVGSTLNLVYPLGNHYSMPDNGKEVLLVGGGCGVAPLLFLAKYLKNNNINPHILLGAKDKDQILVQEEFEKYGEVYISTEDGSQGEKGLLTQHTVLQKNFDKIYTCGPTPMMRAIAKHAEEKTIPCEFSLENTMACGIGACLCCVTKRAEGHVCVCTEGPVFNKWEEE